MDNLCLSLLKGTAERPKAADCAFYTEYVLKSHIQHGFSG